MRPRVPNEIAEDVFLEIGLRVRWMNPPKPIQTREQRIFRVRAPAIHAGVTTAPCDRIWLLGRHAVDEFAEAVNYEAAHSVQAIEAPSICARRPSSSTQGRFCQGGS